MRMLATEAAGETQNCKFGDGHNIKLSDTGIHSIPSFALSGEEAGQQDLEACGKNYPFPHCPSN